MYHEAELTYNGYRHAYYDTIEEMPKTAEIYFPGEKEPKELTVEEMYKLSDDGWKTVIHTVNWGSCDHWCSEPLRTWVDKHFLRIIQYKKRSGEVVGYDRTAWSATLTKENVWKSSVWNS